MKPIELLKQAKRIKAEMNRSAELKGLDSNNEHERLYYSKEQKLNEVLRELLRSRFDELNKIQILELLSLCSSHRPFEPFKILVCVSMRLDELKESKS